MTLSILPVIGSSGYYELASPFDVEVVDKIEYTCKAIRRLSDYLANNEDPKTSIYDAYEINEAIYEADLEQDAYIVSLQSRKGHWLYVPSRYILSYPSVNGVAYRSVMLGISLPPIPVSQDLTAVLSDIKDLVEHSIGASVVVKQVETSVNVLVDYSLHENTQQERNMIIEGQATLYARNVALREENDLLLEKVTALENFIKANRVV